MPRIKQLLADGKFVRMFGVGQLFSPKLIEVIAEHGAFDAIWLDAEHGGLDMKDVELATMAAQRVWIGSLRADAGHGLRLDHAGARSRRGGRDDQHDPGAGRRRKGGGAGPSSTREANAA